MILHEKDRELSELPRGRMCTGRGGTAETCSRGGTGMRRRIVPAALALCLALVLLSMYAGAAETGPQWGTEVQWSYNEDTHTLTLTGSGPMPEGAPPCDRLPLVEDLVIGEGITSISAGAFQTCSSLERVTIPSSVTSIGDSAFSGCESLTGVVFPQGLASIGSYAFYNCSSLTGIAFPGDGLSIGNYAFYQCSQLARVTVSGAGVSIGEYAFLYCNELTTIEISGDAVSIGRLAFSDCDKLTTLEIGADVASIGESAFYSCDALTAVKFQGNVGRIENEAFYSCDKLTTVEMHKDVASIGKQAFLYCDALTTVEIGGDAASIGEFAFHECGKLTSVKIGGDAVSIGEFAFSRCNALTAVKIQGNVSAIGKNAFSGCDALTTVEVGGNLESIGESAFSGLEALAEVRVTGSLGDIGESAFAGCTGLTSLPSVGSMTGEIYYRAFSGCTGLHRVLLPEGVTDINSSAFENCESLTAVWIPASVTYFGSGSLDPNTVKDVYYAGTEAQWKAIKGYTVQYDGLPVIHYDCPRRLPETEAADNDTLRRLIEAGARTGAGLTEIELAGDIDLGGNTLVIEDACNVLLDLKGHRITSSADPAITIVGALTVMDSTETAPPAVTADHSVSYGCRGSISGGGTGDVIDVQHGGAFTLQSGTVRGGGPDAAAITVTGPRTYEENEDNIETTVRIEGGYVEAAGPAILASGETRITVDGGVVLSSGGEAVILGGAEETQRGPSISMYESGVLIHQSSQFSCGVYLPREGAMTFWGGRILVKNGVGILLRDGYLHVASDRVKEITAGGSGTGTLGGSPVALPAGKKIVLDQKSGFCGRGEYDLYCTVSSNLIEEYAPEGIPMDGYELKRQGNRCFFGPMVSYQVTFNPNGGSGTVVTMTTDSSGRITAFPPEPTREGYVFRGWRSDPDYVGYGLNIGYKLSKDTTLYALWTPEGAYIIKFCYYWFEEQFVAYRLTDTNGVLSDWPDLNVTDGTLVGWFVDGEECGEDHVFTGDTTVWGRFPPNTPPPYDITFDPNGGSGSTVTLKTDDQGKLSSWPADPTRDGYVFMGWGGQYSSSSVGQEHTFYQSETLYAHWMPEDGYVISFSRNEDGSGTVSETRNTNLHGRLQQWPDTPRRPGTDYIFSGWYTGASGGSRLARDHSFYGDTKVYAHWIQRGSAAAAGAFVITFDPNEGSGGAVLVTEPGGRLAFLPYSDPVRTGYTFDGWYTGKNDGIIVTTATAFTADTTVYAHWTANGTIPPGPNDPKTFTVTFDSQGGSAVAPQTITSGEKAERPADPTRAGHTFGGWYREADCTTVWNFHKDTVTGDITLYAKWTPDGDPPGPDDSFTITFDPNGGAGGGTMTTGTGGRLAALPGDPVRSGYTFAGWYTGKNDGTEVTTATVFTADTTVYAHWNRGADTGIYYRIYTPYRTPGGRFDVSHTFAAEGTRVTIELSPRRGYEVDWVSAANLVTGREVRLTEYYSDEYSFIMPAGDVEVEIAFADRDSGVSSGGSGGSGGSYGVPNPLPASTKPIRWYFNNGAIYHVVDGLVPAGTWLTRDMLISILYNLDSTSTGEPEFWAVNHSVVPDIYKSWLWGVDKPVSREQAVVILFSYAQYKNYNTFERTDLTGYTDYGLIRPIAQPAMSWARATGLIAGTSANTLSPRNNLTCGQANVILSRFTGKGA